MEQKFSNSLRMSINEKKFIETALHSGLRVDGRRHFDYRDLNVKFGRENGSSEVNLGETSVMGLVTAQLVQPYRDRPNEGSLSIYTDFSPMADPLFDAGRPGESSVELGRIIDRGLRESRSVDMESLCVIPGKFVWSIRLDLHVLDNSGNLVDAATVAALAALLAFRRPDCTLGGEDGQDVIMHPPEVRDPIPLSIHHLPVAVTFAFIGEENMVIIDPAHYEEAVMVGRMTATLNISGDICALQKAGGKGVTQSVIMQCLRIASVKAADVTTKIKNAVEVYNRERELRKVKSCPTAALVDAWDSSHVDINNPIWPNAEEVQLKMEQCIFSDNHGSNKREGEPKSKVSGPLRWDPYSGIDYNELKVSLAVQAMGTSSGKSEFSRSSKPGDRGRQHLLNESNDAPISNKKATQRVANHRPMTLEDAVKPKHQRER